MRTLIAIAAAVGLVVFATGPAAGAIPVRTFWPGTPWVAIGAVAPEPKPRAPVGVDTLPVASVPFGGPAAPRGDGDATTNLPKVSNLREVGSGRLARQSMGPERGRVLQAGERSSPHRGKHFR